MFKLYYFFTHDVPSLVFTDHDLTPCLNYIKQHNYIPTRCTIISPNNRTITFSSNSDLIFSSNG